MGRCEFTVRISSDPVQLITKASEEFAKTGGTLSGDESTGSFVLSSPFGAIQGQYKIVKDDLLVTIVKKPLMISCDRLKEELTKRLGSA